MKDGLFIPAEPLTAVILLGICLLIGAAYVIGYHIGKDDKPK